MPRCFRSGSCAEELGQHLDDQSVVVGLGQAGNGDGAHRPDAVDADRKRAAVRGVRAGSSRVASSRLFPAAASRRPKRYDETPKRRTSRHLRSIHASLSALEPARAAWNSCCSPRRMSMATGAWSASALATNAQPRRQASPLSKGWNTSRGLLCLDFGNQGRHDLHGSGHDQGSSTLIRALCQGGVCRPPTVGGPVRNQGMAEGLPAASGDQVALGYPVAVAACRRVGRQRHGTRDLAVGSLETPVGTLTSLCHGRGDGHVLG